MSKSSDFALGIQAIDIMLDDVEWEGEEGYEQRMRELRAIKDVIKACEKAKITVEVGTPYADTFPFLSDESRIEVAAKILRVRQVCERREK